MCCEQAHVCQCHPEPQTVGKAPRCIRCGDSLSDKAELFCIDCEEGKQWPAS